MTTWNEYVGQKELADFLGVSIMAITRWTRQGMPKHGPAKYPLRECAQWRIQQLEQRGPVGDRAKLIAAQTKRQEVEIEKLLGNLIDVELHGRCLNEIAVIISSQLDGLGARIAFEVIGQSDVGTIQEVVLRETRAIRAAIASAIAASADHLQRDGFTEVSTAQENGSQDSEAAPGEDGGSVGRRKSRAPARKSRARPVA